MYQHAFKFYELGYGTAIALLIILAGAILSLLYIRVLRVKYRSDRHETSQFIPASVAAYAILAILALFFVAAVHLADRGQLHAECESGNGVVPHPSLDNFRYIFDNGYVQGFANSLMLG